MFYTIIVAVDERGGFVKDGKIPWHYREDFQWFKEKTMGHPCIMGRGTFEDIKRYGKPGSVVLPGRFGWVITSQAETYDVGASGFGTLLYPRDIEKFLPSVDGFIEHPNEVMVLGGLGVYLDILPLASVVHLTHIKKDYQCDQFFPVDWVYNNFDLVYSDSNRHPELQFNTYIRRKGP